MGHPQTPPWRNARCCRGNERAVIVQLFPTQRPLSAEHLYADLEFPSGKDGRPYVVINMVSSVDGKIALRGRSRGIGSRLDRAAMLQLRAAVDVVMAGAETIRGGEGDLGVSPELERRREAHGRPGQPILATVSARLDLSPDLAFFRRATRAPVVFTSTAAPAERRQALADRAHLVELGDDRTDLSAAFRYCASELQARAVLVEGGPQLNQQLFECGLVDELFWTVAPKVFGGAATRTLVEGPAPGRVPLAQLGLVSAILADDEIFLRYRVKSTS